jgi:hypothetical protein
MAGYVVKALFTKNWRLNVKYQITNVKSMSKFKFLFKHKDTKKIIRKFFYLCFLYFPGMVLVWLFKMKKFIQII